MRPIDTIIDIPKRKTPNGFLGVRRHDVHTGIDLAADLHTPVRAIAAGVVIDIDVFTGPRADSPWWNETSYVSIEHFINGRYYIVLYGEISPGDIYIGDEVEAGRIIGSVQQVIARPKPLQQPTMLHLELYDPKLYSGPVWCTHEDMSDIERYLSNTGLLDPTDLVARISSHEQEPNNTIRESS